MDAAGTAYLRVNNGCHHGAHHEYDYRAMRISAE
jgi:hypothetical protein